MQDIFNIIGTISPLFKKALYVLEICNGLQVVWTLFLAKTAVEVCTHAYVKSIPGQLTNMIEVVDDLFQIAVGDFRR